MTLALKRFDCVEAAGQAIAGLACSPDGESLAACFGQTLLVVTWRECEVTHRFVDEREIEAVAFAPDGARIAAAYNDGRVCIFDLTGAHPAATMQSHERGYYALAWSPDGRVIAGGHYEPRVSVFDVVAEKLLLTLDPKVFSDEGRTSVAFSSDVSLMASTGYNSVFLWSLSTALASQKKTARRKKVSTGKYGFVIDAAFAPSGDRLAGLVEIEGRSELQIWNAGTRKKIGRVALPHYAHRIAWPADGGFIAVTEPRDDGVSLWDPATFKRSAITLDEDTEQSVEVIAPHPRGGIVVGCASGAVIGWEPV